MGHGSTKDSGCVGTCRGGALRLEGRGGLLHAFCPLEETAQRHERKGRTWEHFHKPCHGSRGLQGRAILGRLAEEGASGTHHHSIGLRGTPSGEECSRPGVRCIRGDGRMPTRECVEVWRRGALATGVDLTPASLVAPG